MPLITEFLSQSRDRHHFTRVKGQYVGAKGGKGMIRGDATGRREKKTDPGEKLLTISPFSFH